MKRKEEEGRGRKRKRRRGNRFIWGRGTGGIKEGEPERKHVCQW